jgi:transposase
MGADRPTVDPATQAALRRIIQQDPGRISRRAQAVVWWLEGASQSRVSRRLGMTRQSVQEWCARFRVEGVAGLCDRRRTGRPRTAGEEVESAVAECLRESDLPGTRGPGGWTVPRLVSALMTRGLVVGARTMRRVLGRLRARWRRGQLVAKGDPDRAAVLARLAGALAEVRLAAERAGRRLLVLFEDDADLALLPRAGASWQLPDRPATIPTPGQNQTSGLFGSLGLEGELIITESARKTAVAFSLHLEEVVARFPNKEVAMIMDNVGIHHAKATVAWLTEHPQVHRLFLPRYSPNDNAQERVWGWLRADVCRNRAFPDLASKQAAARAFFAGLEPPELSKRCVPDRLLSRLLAETGGDNCQRT